jgi:ABC-2 type transport system permease protein
LVNIIHFFLFFFTGIAIPIDSLPAGLYALAQVIPLTHGMTLLRQLDLAGSIKPAIGQSLLLLSITTTLWVTLGVTAFLFAYRYARVNGIFNRF